MNEYFLTPGAFDDLSEIWDWIAADNVPAANALIADIKVACGQIAEHPLLGGKHPRWTRRSARFLLVRNNYWIVYDPVSQPLEIMRIIHAARDIAKVLASES